MLETKPNKEQNKDDRSSIIIGTIIKEIGILGHGLCT
jgi:hypothetical protein